MNNRFNFLLMFLLALLYFDTLANDIKTSINEFNIPIKNVGVFSKMFLSRNLISSIESEIVKDNFNISNTQQPYESLINSQINQNTYRFNSKERSVFIPEYNKNSRDHLVVEFDVQLNNSKITDSFGLEKIQLSISHKRISDIKVVLESPDGTEVWITNRNGGEGKDYVETIFSQNAFNGPISEGTAPFLGEWIPDGFLAHFNNGQDPNGRWKLHVFDLQESVLGKFESASIFFSNRPAKNIISQCSMYNLSNCFIPEGNGELLPDLTIIPEFTKNNFTYRKRKNGLNAKISFGVAVVNIGIGPLELVASNKWYFDGKLLSKNKEEIDSISKVQEIEQLMYQNIYKIKKGTLSKREMESSFIHFDRRPGHEHFHSENFITYKIYKPDSTDNVENWELVAQGTKASFCIWNLSYCRDELNNCQDSHGKFYRNSDLKNYGFGGKYTGCNENYQGLSVGGIDSYGENYEGQTIELPINISSGEYALFLEVDPDNKFSENRKDNNIYIHKFFINN